MVIRFAFLIPLLVAGTNACTETPPPPRPPSPAMVDGSSQVSPIQSMGIGATNADHSAQNAARTLEPWETELPEAVSTLIDKIDWNNRPVIGVREKAQGESRYRLFGPEVGLEQWEDGKRSQYFRERWRLYCQSAVMASEMPNCSLDVDRIHLAFVGTVGPMISTTRFTTEDNTLVFRQVNWEAGVLDFAILPRGGRSTEASIRFNYDGDLMILRSFKATTLSTPLFADTASVLELRIPEYSYALYAPFPIKGLKSSAHRKWNRMLATLSDEDRRTWTSLVQQKRQFVDKLGDPEKQMKDLLERTLGRDRVQQLDREGGRATPEEERQLADALDREWLNKFREWLSRSAISHEGQQRMIDSLSSSETGRDRGSQ